MATAERNEEKESRRAKGEDVTDSDEEALSVEDRAREMRRLKSEDKESKAADDDAETTDADDDADAGLNVAGNKGARKQMQRAGGNSVRERKSSGKLVGAKLRSQTEKPRSKRSLANGSGGKRSGALTRSKSSIGTGSTSSSSPSTGQRKTTGLKQKAKTRGSAGAKVTKTTKKREKDVAKSVGGAREALQQARKLERTNSKALMAAEAEKLGIGGKTNESETKKTGNVASASFMTMAGRYVYDRPWPQNMCTHIKHTIRRKCVSGWMG